MTEMRLTLTLDGVQQLTGAINSLINLLNSLDQRLQSLVQTFEALAQAIRDAIAAIPDSIRLPNVVPGNGGPNAAPGGVPPIQLPPIPGAAPGGNGGGGGPRNSRRGMDWSSILFSLVQGQFNVAFAKFVTGLVRVGSRLAIVAAAIGLTIGAIVFLISVLKKLADAVQETIKGQRALGFATWNNAANPKDWGMATGLARTLGMDPMSLASALRNLPGKGLAARTILRDLWETLQRDPNAGYIKAEMFGLQDLVNSGFSDLSKQEFERLMAGREAAIDMRRFSGLMRDVNSVLDDTKNIAGTVAAVMWGPSARLARGLFDKILGRDQGSKSGDKLEKAATKFEKAVQVFADKSGVFGGADRARAAWPSAWSFYAYEQYMVREARNLGALGY